MAKRRYVDTKRSTVARPVRLAGPAAIRFVQSVILAAFVAVAGLVTDGATSATASEFKRPPPAQGFSYPDCFCTNRGERVELGGFACLKVDGKEFLARCEMSLNNPSWRQKSDGCPISRISNPPSAG
ncbi:MAG: hypothetical protein ACTSSQ_06595 [Alphaproteobacteria bacterium]